MHANSDYDVLVSGGADGQVLVWGLRHGEYVRTILPSATGPIRWLSVSTYPHIIILVSLPSFCLFAARSRPCSLAFSCSCSQRGNVLHLYTINGRFLLSVDCGERINFVASSPDGNFVVTGSEKGNLVIRDVHKFVHFFSTSVARHSGA